MKLVSNHKNELFNHLKHGGKAVSLQRLKNMNLNVPNFFVIPSDILIKDIHNNKKVILNHFKKLKTRFVSVRSSASLEDSEKFSFAGQFNTFLNVTHKDLITKIINVKKNINTNQLKSYYLNYNISTNPINMAVIVQEMIHSDTSGIGFSINPVTGKDILIEAGFGLGDYIVSGIITPDKYIINKNSFLITEKIINYQENKIQRVNKITRRVEISIVKRNAQKIDDAKILDIVKKIIQIEKKYNRPVDIEWAIKDDNLFILQARPITNILVRK